MRELRFVKQADEGTLLVETADGLEEFRLPVDTALRDAVRAEAPPRSRPAAPVAAEPGITAREIQIRVRAGEVPEDIAEAYGVGLEWVRRFAVPVLDERERVAHEARRARARRSTTDGQTVVFGEAVDERFAAHGIDPGSVRWDAHRRDDGQWIITARWVGGDAERVAEWSFQLSGRTVAPLDDAAADLLSDRPIRPLVAVAAEPKLSAAIAPPLAPGVVAFPAMADAHTGQLPRVEEVFDQEKYPADDEPAVPASPPELFDTVFDEEPSLPLNIEGRQPARPRRRPKLTDLGTGARTETDDERAARAHVPSWDDILLGVRRKND